MLTICFVALLSLVLQFSTPTDTQVLASSMAAESSSAIEVDLDEFDLDLAPNQPHTPFHLQAEQPALQYPLESRSTANYSGFLIRGPPALI